MKKINIGLFKVLVFWSVIISAYFMCYNVYWFAIGFHNVDLGSNMRYLNAVEGINYYDITLEGKEISYEELYRVGCRQMIYSFLNFGISLTAFVIFLFSLGALNEKMAR